MRSPTLLSRRKQNVHKNNFGHILIIAGSKHMLGAAALSSLATLRSGAGLVTVAVPKSLNLTLQKKISNEVMTWGLDETREQTFSLKAFAKIRKAYPKYNAIAIGPGLGQHKSTRALVLKIIATSPVPLIIDADALNILATSVSVLKKTTTAKILTPHPGEMTRLTKTTSKQIKINRRKAVQEFVRKYPNTTLLLKGHRTLVGARKKTIYTNTTGNAGMATAGSGDVLTGIIAAFCAQGLSPFEAAKYGAYIHGKAGDRAAKAKSKTSLISSDIIDFLPDAW